MDRYQASVLNRITDKHGPGWTILALVIMHRWSIGFIGGSGGLYTIGHALGWW